MTRNKATYPPRKYRVVEPAPVARPTFTRRLLTRLVAALDPLTARTTYTITHGLARGLKRRGGLGFLAPPSHLLSKEEAFLAGLDLTGGCVYDVGGYEGLYALFFASRVGMTGKVVCFEPLPASQQRIRRNIAANGFEARITLADVALGAQEGQTTFRMPKGESRGQASGRPGAFPDRADAVEVSARVTRLDTLWGQFRPPTLIKIDVEGMELDVVLGAKQTLARCHPALFIEVHGHDATDSMRAIVRELAPLGYTVQHVEQGTILTATSTPAPGSLHLYAHVR